VLVVKGSMWLKGCNYEEHISFSGYQTILRLEEVLNTPGFKWAIVDIYPTKTLVSIYREGSCGSHDGLHIVTEGEDELKKVMSMIKGKVDRIKYFDYTRK